MPILFTPIPTETARRYQAGGEDANGQRPERTLSDGDGNPCRHCLRFIPKGRGMLILSHRPFPAPQPYADLGPVFLCAEHCDAPADQAINAIEKAMAKHGPSDHRPVFVHGTYLRPDQIAKLRKLGAIPSFLSSSLVPGGDSVVTMWGPQRAAVA